MTMEASPNGKAAYPLFTAEMLDGRFAGSMRRLMPGMPKVATKRRFVVLFILFVVVVINYLDRANLSMAGPQLSANLHLNAVSMGLVFSGFGWTYAAFQIPASWFVDRIHPRYLYCFALALWSFGTLAIGFSSGLAMILALRLVIGACEAPAYPINNRVVTTWFGEQERGAAIGFYTSGQFVGLAFLSPLLSWLAGSFGWRSVFFATGLLGLVWAAIWFAMYRDPAHFPGINDAEIQSIAEGGGIPNLSDTLLSKNSTFLWSDLRFVLTRRKLWGIYIGQFGLASTLWFFLTWFPTYLIEFRHIAFMKAGFLASVPFLGAFLGVISGGLLSDWLLRNGVTLTVARKTPIIIGLLLSTVILAANYVSSPPWIVASLTCAFFGTGLASVTWSLVSAMAPIRLIGLTGGVFNFFANLSAITVPVVIGFLVRNQSFSRALGFVSGTALLGAFSYIFLVGKIERLEG